MKKAILILLAAALLVPCLTGCSGGELKKVRVHEVTHSVFYAAQYIAMERGYFADEGLEVELTNAGGADKAMTALLAGQADIALMGPESSVYVYNEGRADYTQVIGQLTTCDGAFIVGREPDEDYTLETLRGKSILDVDVRSDVQFNLMAGAFIGGEGDYTTLFEPTATEVEQQGEGYVLASVGALAGEVPYTCYQVTRSALEEDRETIEAFLRAIYRAQKFVEESDARTVAEALAPAFSDASIDTLETVVLRYREIGAFATSPVMTEDAYERLLDIMEQAGELDARPPYAEIIQNSIAEQVMQEES